MKILRRWQRSAFARIENILSQKIDRALVAACPGSGKTLLSAHIIDLLLKRGVACVVVVVPSKALKRQWYKALREVGLNSVHDVDNSTLEYRHYRGDDMFDPTRPINIVTYAQVASNPDLFAALCSRHKTVCVLDEIHHADDEERFGTALITAFSDAVFKLSLSGTPFNTKGGNLAFCSTKIEINNEGKEERITIADYNYSYGEAMRAEGTEDDPKVVRAVQFVRWKGTAWVNLRDRTTGNIKHVVFNGKKSDPLFPLLDPDSDNLQKMVKAGLAKLEEIRRHQSNAGMLITAQDSSHCEAIADYIKSLGVRDYVVIKYDVPGAHALIEQFEKSAQRVLIAVKMISEGVDIKRLRVGVYASNVLTRMFFTQFIGRFVRWDDAINWGQISYVFIPYHEVLVKYAEEIEEMINAAIIPKPDGDGLMPDKRYDKIDGGADGEADGAIERGKTWEELDKIKLEEISKAGIIPVGSLTLDQIRQLREHFTTGTNHPEGSANPTEPLTSKQNDQMVARIVMIASRIGLDGYDYDKVNTLANKAVGISRKDKLTSDQILEKRLQFLKAILADVFAKEKMKKGGIDEARPS